MLSRIVGNHQHSTKIRLIIGLIRDLGITEEIIQILTQK